MKPAIRAALAPRSVLHVGVQTPATESPYSADTVDRMPAFQSYAGLEELTWSVWTRLEASPASFQSYVGRDIGDVYADETHIALDRTPTREVTAEQMPAAARAYPCGATVAPLYLYRAAGQPVVATTLLAAATELQSMGRDEGTLACTGVDVVVLWRDTLRRALAAKRAILLDGVETLRGEPFAQEELARLIAPERLVVLAGCDHHRRIVAWSPSLAVHLGTAILLCLHEGPCVADADAWAIVDQVAGYDGVTRAHVLTYRRTAPSHWRARSPCPCCARRG